MAVPYDHARDQGTGDGFHVRGPAEKRSTRRICIFHPVPPRRKLCNRLLVSSSAQIKDIALPSGLLSTRDRIPVYGRRVKTPQSPDPSVPMWQGAH